MAFLHNFKHGDVFDSDGTFYQGYLQTTFEHLVRKLGAPTETAQDEDEKVAYEWILKCADGLVVTIYDWKGSYRHNTWHVGGKTVESLLRARELV